MKTPVYKLEKVIDGFNDIVRDCLGRTIYLQKILGDIAQEVYSHDEDTLILPAHCAALVGEWETLIQIAQNAMQAVRLLCKNNSLSEPPIFKDIEEQHKNEMHFIARTRKHHLPAASIH